MRTVVILLSLLAACRRSDPEAGEPQPAAVPVTCRPVRAAPIAERVSLRGLVRPPPDRDALVAAAVPGRVREVRVQEGDAVTRGQELAVVDDPALASALAEADAAQAAAAAAHENARLAQARARRLFDEGVAPRRDVEDADAKLAAAAAEVKSAGARRGLAEAQRERAQVRAPRDGTVVKVLRRAGELVDGTAATAIVEIADLSALELHADVAAADLVRLAVGQKAVVRLDAVPGAEINAQVVRVAPGVDAATALGGVRLALAPAEHARPLNGLAAGAQVEVAARTVILAPARALRRSIDGADQVVVCAGDKAAVRRVTVGARLGDEVELRSGAVPGELLVADHVLGLEDGAVIAPRAEGP
jgi:RND family efflux transporter MFP subunit